LDTFLPVLVVLATAVLFAGFLALLVGLAVPKNSLPSSETDS
jgi:hypothetical protein